ncbi:MAG: hypothetical protein Q9203_004843 [Teloschistes exilis]
MSLYYEAAKFLMPSDEQSGSLKSRIFNSQDLKSQPKQIYALVAEASKWSSILSEVVTQSKLLQQERKLSPGISLLLVHDLLLSKSGIAAPASHPLRVAVTRHKARLSAELTKIRIKRGFTSLDELRTHLKSTTGDYAAEKPLEDTLLSSKAKGWPHPRWVRMNTLKVRQTDQFQTLNPDYEIVKSLGEVLTASSGEKVFYMDRHVPDLVALPPHTNVSRLNGYGNGSFIVQDKASCFPAYLLDPRPEDGPCLDACAAPGNKTTHLVAILQGHGLEASKSRVWACERDKARAEILKKMVHLAGCDDMVSVKAGQDFLQLDPHKAPWNAVWSLLLDPSCSGSGMVDRDETIAVTLPSNRSDNKHNKVSRKRKRKTTGISNIESSSHGEAKPDTSNERPSSPGNGDTELSSRLRALSAFQLRLLLHSFGFPNARKISYSTCSIHAEENEYVVIAALKSEDAKEHGWRLLRRDEQVEGMKSWHRRGDIDACRDVSPGNHSLNPEDIAEACIRCEVGTEEGTQGFFVAAFSRPVEDSRCDPAGLNGDRNAPSGTSELIESGAGDIMAPEEWEGFSDSE